MEMRHDIASQGTGDCISIRRGKLALISGSRHTCIHLLESSVLAVLRSRGGAALWIDGGNSFNPYSITESVCNGLAPSTDLLEHIFIARAFTAHQLNAIAKGAAEKSIQYGATVAVISSCTELFISDVAWKEGLDLLEDTLLSLARLAHTTGCWVIATDSSWLKQDAIQRLLASSCDLLLDAADLDGRKLCYSQDSLNFRKVVYVPPLERYGVAYGKNRSDVQK
ncbi:MAG: hypothetical protein QXP70_02190 [Methanomassiliicoccales archaeon]